MSWLLLGVLSAVALGIYDLMKKTAVNGNAVLSSAVFVLADRGLMMDARRLDFDIRSVDILSNWMRVDPIGFRGHGLLFLRALLSPPRGCRLTLPLKIFQSALRSPIRSTAPYGP